MLFSKNPKTIFQTISTDLIEALKIPPDLSFICDAGKMVHTHKILLATFSPFLRSTLASLESAHLSKSVVLSMPEASGSALEQVIHILCKPWSQNELTLSLDQITVIQVLGIPVGFSVSKEVNTTLKESSQYPYSEASKVVNQVEIGVALEENLGIPDNTALDVPQEGLDPDPTDYIENKAPKCIHCDTIFRDSTPESIEEITIHLGEVHFEMDLQVEQFRRFLAGSKKCEECAFEITGDYVQKEHILLKHPWPLLKTTVEEIVNMGNANEEASDLEEDGYFEKTVEEATLSLLTKEFDSIENESPPTDPSNGNDTLLKMEEFIKSLNIAPLKEKSVNSPSSLPRTVASCPKCSQKWTYNLESRMSDLKSRIKSHVVDLHFDEELKLLLQNSFVGNSCQLCGKAVETEDLQKKHIRKVHNALESDVMSIIELMLGNDMHRKDPRKKKRRCSTDNSQSNPKSAKISSFYTSEVTTSKTNDLINDNIEGVPSSIVIQSSLDFSDPDDDIMEVEREACKEIQQIIEFSDSEDDN